LLIQYVYAYIKTAQYKSNLNSIFPVYIQAVKYALYLTINRFMTEHVLRANCVHGRIQLVKFRKGEIRAITFYTSLCIYIYIYIYSIEDVSK